MHIFSRDTLELFKPKISLLVLITALVGYFIAAGNSFSWMVLLALSVGTLMSSGGAAALNNVLERDVDLLMERTKNRALADGKLDVSVGLAIGVGMVTLGTALLAWQANLVTGFVALLTAFIYVLVYTPLKRITWLNTFVGAIPGALPPLGGYAAHNGIVDFDSIFLFMILFVWQIPHFFSIAWLCKEDYARAGFQMLPVIKGGEQRIGEQVWLFTLLLINLMILPLIFGGSTWGFYMLGIALLSWPLIKTSYRFFLKPCEEWARGVLRYSLVFLPAYLMVYFIFRAV